MTYLSKILIKSNPIKVILNHRFCSYYKDPFSWEKTIRQKIEKGISREIEEGISKNINRRIEKGISKRISKKIEKKIDFTISKQFDPILLDIFREPVDRIIILLILHMIFNHRF